VADAYHTPAGEQVDGLALSPLGGPIRHKPDLKKLHHPAKDRLRGYRLQNTVCPVPLFFSRTGTNVWLEDQFKGWTVFLLCGGPSLADKYDLAQLIRTGVMTFAKNISPTIFRPQLWTQVDGTGNFLRSIFLDPRIMKFVPFEHADDLVFDSNAWRFTDMHVADCPNVVYWRRNSQFNHEQFLSEDTINWGQNAEGRCSLGHKGSRSVMLSAVRICFALGFRTVFLVGADFTMSLGAQNYAWKQDRSKSSVKHNNETYQILNARFDALRPIFERHRFQVYNCNPDSGLKSFDHVPFAEAVDYAVRELPPADWQESRRAWHCQERTEGLYDRKANDEAAKKHEKKAKKATTRKGRAEHTREAAICREFFGHGPDAARALRAKLEAETGAGPAETGAAAEGIASPLSAPEAPQETKPARLTPEELEARLCRPAE
jgi:hypothetical protein